jgi:hypothetical protein
MPSQVGALGQLFASHGHRLSAAQTARLLRMLVRVLAHCQAADGDRCLRSLVRIAGEEVAAKHAAHVAAAAAEKRSLPPPISAVVDSGWRWVLSQHGCCNQHPVVRHDDRA